MTLCYLSRSTTANDANGNTTSSAGIQNIYDFENRMTQHGTGLFLVYDGDGNRVSETIGGTTTKFLVDDHNPTGLPQVLDEIVNGPVTRTYPTACNESAKTSLLATRGLPASMGTTDMGTSGSSPTRRVPSPTPMTLMRSGCRSKPAAAAPTITCTAASSTTAVLAYISSGPGTITKRRDGSGRKTPSKVHGARR